jgi:hypothetical protein
MATNNAARQSRNQQTHRGDTKHAENCGQSPTPGSSLPPFRALIPFDPASLPRKYQTAAGDPAFCLSEL